MLGPPNLSDSQVDASLEAVTVGGPGLVAVGLDTILDGTRVTDTAAVWTSADGRSWTRVPHTPEFESAARTPFSTTFMWDVAAGGDVVVAVGSEGISDDEWRAAIWVSPDGLEWERISLEAEPFHNAAVLSVIRFRDEFLAAGYSCDGDRICRGAVWASDDGQAWDHITVADEHLTKITSWDDGLVAIGSQVWTSQDGRTWIRSPISGWKPVSPTTPAPMSYFIDVADVGAGILVVGASDDDPDNPYDTENPLPPTIAWYTEDGTAWTDVSHMIPGDAGLFLVETTDTQVFVDGCTFSESECGLWMWDTLGSPEAALTTSAGPGTGDGPFPGLLSDMGVLEVGAVAPLFTGTLLDIAFETPIELTDNPFITAEQYASVSLVEQGTWSLDDHRAQPVLVYYAYGGSGYPPDEVINRRLPAWEDHGFAALVDERADELASIVVVRTPTPWFIWSVRAGGYSGPIIADPLAPQRGSDPHLWGFGHQHYQSWVLLDGEGAVVGGFCSCDLGDPPRDDLLVRLVETLG